ncbi:MAG: N-acetyltransferase [Candidatus Bathyarchaeota archaeon]
MRIEPPEKVSQEKITLDVRELEPLLTAPKMEVNSFPSAYVSLETGEKMVIRSLKREEVPSLLQYVKQLLEVDHDFYDIVGARVYAEILGWYRNRLKDPYNMVGVVDGELVGYANGRLFNEDIGISLHTLALRRGARIGAILYYAKLDYEFEVLNQKEYWSTFESYNGLRRWGIGMAQPSYPWPDQQHELGGAKIYYITKKYWSTFVKKYLQDLVRTDLIRPVPKDLLEKNDKFTLPKELVV